MNIENAFHIENFHRSRVRWKRQVQRFIQWIVTGMRGMDAQLLAIELNFNFIWLIPGQMGRQENLTIANPSINWDWRVQGNSNLAAVRPRQASLQRLNFL